MWFKLNMAKLGPGVMDADPLSGVEGSSCVLDELKAAGSGMEGRLSEVGTDSADMWTWVAWSKKKVQN